MMRQTFNRQGRHAIRDHMKETSIFFNRSVVAIILVSLFFLLLIGRMAQLQVLEYESYQTQSDNNRIRLLPLPPKRGLVFDRQGKLLAENSSDFTLEIIPEQVDDIQTTLTELQTLLTLPQKDIDRFNKELKELKRNRRFESLMLSYRLDEDKRALFSVNKHLFAGVSVNAQLLRNYPYKDSLAHVIGYMRAISEEHLEQIEQANYRGTRRIGVSGLESKYEQDLHGATGHQSIETDVTGRVLKTLSRTEPQPGKDLHLHLDVELQQLGYELMQGRRGVIIAMDPNDGAVLSMISSPAYDPNLFVTGIDPETYKKLSTSRDKPEFNRALQGTYSPASTIKPLLGWLGLQSKVISRGYSIQDKGYYQLENDDTERKYRDWIAWGHGQVNLYQAIMTSCDTYYYEMAFNLGIDRIASTMQQAGFGQATGIDLYGEKSGLMPSREWKRQSKNLPWFPGETLNIGIGQGDWNATALQLTSMTAMMAHPQGKRYKPHLVASLQQGDEVIPIEAELAEQQLSFAEGFSDFDYVKKAMHAVVNHHKGTAYKAFKGTPYQVAGKSGTAQLASIAQDEEYIEEDVAERLRDNAMFIAYAPYDKPLIALTVIIENAGGGSSHAAPVARKMMDNYLSRHAETQMLFSAKKKK